MTAPSGCVRALAWTLFAILAGAVAAQGRDGYLNVESPQVSPIAYTELAVQPGVGALGGVRRLLVVCNTPDNSVELWDVGESQQAAPTFVGRCWVGLEPVSVLVEGDRFWTANFLGDSVTTGTIEVVAGQPRARVLATRRVGDEPMDLTLFDDQGVSTLVCSLHSRSAVAWLDPDTLQPYAAGVDEHRVAEAAPTGQATVRMGIKEPRAVRVVGGQLYALGMKGGVTHGDSLFDNDLMVATAAAGGAGQRQLVWGERLGGLGSTNYNMRAASNGDLFVVGAEAGSYDIDGLQDVLDANSASQPAQTGFVRSFVYRIRRAAGALAVERRDLNHGSSGQVVGVDQRAAQPTDVALLEQAGAVEKVFVAAMGSDAVTVLAPLGADLGTWRRRVIRLDSALPADPAGPARRYGPRGLALGSNAQGDDRLYVLNRIDHSIVVIDAAAEVVLAHAPLANDPTPDHVKAGRHWLYDAQLSASKFVSCASCHPDGRTDALAWRIGDPGGVGTPLGGMSSIEMLKLAGTGSIPDAGGVISDPAFFVTAWWLESFSGFTPDAWQTDDKREMVTQSLQGLLNWEVEPGARDLYSNAPYHWRGDQLTVQDFEEGFVNLLGASQMTQAEREEMEEFVLSISYPPNPKQPRTRTYDPQSPAGQGLALYHTQPTFLAGRSCSTCHELPDGSNGRLTVFVTDPVIPKFVTKQNRQSIESAALRGLFQKEPVWQEGGFDAMAPDSIRIGHFGLNHNGIQPFTTGVSSGETPTNLTTINTFLDVFFDDPSELVDGQKVKQFVHEMDWGVAPMIGHLARVEQSQWPSFLAPPAGLYDQFVEMIEQAHEANAGLVVWFERGGSAPVRRGFRYFPDGTFYEEPSGAAFSLQQLHALMTAPTDSITALAVPLGSERRVASPSGVVAGWDQAPFSAPVDFVDLHANTAYASVPELPGAAPAPNNISAPNGDPVAFNGIGNVGEVYSATIHRFQDALLQSAKAAEFNLPRRRHEAPRRLRVRSDEIRPGAKLLIGVPDPNAVRTNDPTTTPRVTIELELHPAYVAGSNGRVWETAAELDPLQVYKLMMGGAAAPGVESTVVDTIVEEYQLTLVNATLGWLSAFFGKPFPAIPAPGTEALAPDVWNTFPIQVRNPGPGGAADPTGPVSPVRWVTLTLG